jgi:TPR repeat protein
LKLKPGKGLLMELALAGTVWFAAALWLLARGLVAKDYATLKDVELIRLHGLQKKRLAAAGKAGAERYQAALERMGKLRFEMKQRGLVEADVFVDDRLTQDTLERAARQRYSRTVDEVRTLSAKGDPSALYQMGVLLRMSKENDMASRFIATAAESGDAQAQFAWALALLGAEDEPAHQRQADALTWLQIAAHQGHRQAQLALAGLLKSLPPAIVWAALREARRRIRQPGTPQVRPAAPREVATPPAPGLWQENARQGSFS